MALLTGPGAMGHDGRKMKLPGIIRTVLAAGVVMGLCAAEPALAGDKIQPAKVEISGRGFEIHLLRKGAEAFRMRGYRWSDLPESIEGLPYTQMSGGGTAVIHLKVKEAGTVYVAVATNQMLDMQEKGWDLPMPDRSNTFTYTDQNLTLMVVMSRKVAEGEELDIPQMGWTGTIVLLPPRSQKSSVPAVAVPTT